MRSILEEEIGRRRVMKQSSDFIWSPFSKSWEKVELAAELVVVVAELVAEADFTQRAHKREGEVGNKKGGT